MCPDGLALFSASTSATRFSFSASSVNDARPIVHWTMPALSARNCTWPALAFFTASATSCVTVPTFGFGIRPRGPENLTELPDDAHRVGRGDRDVEIDLAFLDLGRQIVEADDIGAGRLGRLGLARPARIPRRARVLPVPWGSTSEPRTDLVGLLGIDAEIDRHVDRLVELRGRVLLDDLDGVDHRIGLVAIDLRFAAP